MGLSPRHRSFVKELDFTPQEWGHTLSPAARAVVVAAPGG